MSGSFRSIHDGTPKTMSAYSHVFVQNHSFTTIISIRGSVFMITSYAHFEFPRIEFPFTHHAVFVGVGMWVSPVNVFVPTLSGRSPCLWECAAPAVVYERTVARAFGSSCRLNGSSRYHCAAPLNTSSR